MNRWRPRLIAAVEYLGVALLVVLTVLGTFRAWSFEGRDFAVFHAVFVGVTEGRGLEIYREAPDRYLYAPGFAFLFSPLGLLSERVGLLIFSILKMGALAHLLLTIKERQLRPVSWGLFAWGALFAGRSLLIDFTYGQVNLLVVWAAFTAVWLHLGDHRSRRLAFLSWAVAAIAAASKLLTLPILLLPWLRRGRPQAAWERLGTIAGLAVLLVVPFVSEGWENGLGLHRQWWEALQSRGFPLETHNQSLPAFVHRILGESLSPYIAMEHRFDFSWRLLSGSQVWGLSLAWVFASAVAVLGWITYPVFLRREIFWRPAASSLWAGVLVALLILPSHLVWKPYFVFGVGLGAALMPWLMERRRRAWLAVPLFFFANFTTYEFIGRPLAAYFESYCSMMAAHLGLIALGVLALRDRLKAPADSVNPSRWTRAGKSSPSF